MTDNAVGVAARSNQAGKFQLVPQQVRVDYEDGSSVVGPAGEVTVATRSIVDTVKDVKSIFCSVFPTSSICGPSAPPATVGRPGCYTITGPDGTVRDCTIARRNLARFRRPS
jgi:hypothetical protein